jgi:hypothetical protein
MKVHPRRKPLTFGDFVAGVYHTWGKRRAKGIVRLAIEVHVIEFRGKERYVVSRSLQPKSGDMNSMLNPLPQPAVIPYRIASP